VLIRVGLARLVQPKWTEQILDETFRNLRANRPDLDTTGLERTRVGGTVGTVPNVLPGQANKTLGTVPTVLTTHCPDHPPGVAVPTPPSSLPSAPPPEPTRP